LFLQAVLFGFSHGYQGIEACVKFTIFGFRPGRGPHQALDALTVGIQWKRVNWVLDADIRGFFDNMSHEWTMKFIEHRLAYRRILRLIQKWLKAGVSEDGQ
jgi:RNA-directed DNA polymerase